MGKNKSQDKQHNKSDVISNSAVTNKVKKSPKPQSDRIEKLSSIIKSVGLPENTESLSADQLNENQKHALKKVCAHMYGHQHTETKKLPAKSLESATAQLAEEMKAKLAERKKQKKLTKNKTPSS